MPQQRLAGAFAALVGVVAVSLSVAAALDAVPRA
jgi:hypothetical protein